MLNRKKFTLSLTILTASILTLLLIWSSFASVIRANDSRCLIVVTPSLNVRTGPSLDHPIIDVLPVGATVATLQFDSPRGWWQIHLPTGQTGWVSGEPRYVTTYSNLAGSLCAATATTPVTSTITTSVTISPTVNPPTEPTETLVFQTSSGGAIYAIDLDGTNLRYLTHGLDPAISPDGQQVAFTRWNSQELGTLGDVWLINIDGTAERVIHPNIRQPKSPAWSPDGTQLALNMQHGGWVTPRKICGSSPRFRPGADNIEIEHDADDGDFKLCFTVPPQPVWGLRLLDVTSGVHEDIAHDIPYTRAPTWDPANPARLIYHGNWGLIALDLNQGHKTAFTDQALDHAPVFSPDGRHIAISYYQHDHWEIHRLNTDGSERIRLTETPLRDIVRQQIEGQEPRSANNTAPAWSPDGSQIAFLSDRSGQWDIWVMNADGSEQRPLFTPETLAEITFDYKGVEERMLSWGRAVE